MTHVNLNFDGPFTFNDLVNQKEAFNPGIYIWGFKYPDPNKFIPYYVGKSLTNIVGRIAHHKKDIIKGNSTYVRLSAKLMETFYRERDLDRLIKPNKSSLDLPKWFNGIWQEEIQYINTRWFIHRKMGKDYGNKGDYPINLLNPLPNDFLKNNIQNLFICYAVPRVKGEILTPENDSYEHIEAITKCSLRGRTLCKKEKPVISNAFTWNNITYVVNITPINFEGIFKSNGSNITPDCSSYPGY